MNDERGNDECKATVFQFIIHHCRVHHFTRGNVFCFSILYNVRCGCHYLQRAAHSFY
jgi:hypothetical protein